MSVKYSKHNPTLMHHGTVNKGAWHESQGVWGVYHHCEGHEQLVSRCSYQHITTQVPLSDIQRNQKYWIKFTHSLQKCKAQSVFKVTFEKQQCQKNAVIFIVLFYYPQIFTPIMTFKPNKITSFSLFFSAQEFFFSLREVHFCYLGLGFLIAIGLNKHSRSLVTV